ncbi:hypothetical protein PENANT_c010G00575 [Penicillium antarcticum]|uniref:Uncharacterized protein n=1 Tax=Penicillium antarcticum TaxID=416450 RepID=A0A1V6Q8X2_9EURO|nr:hypothetical protein PENANT_c010G00575 [Penicillium antarcticum]
MYAPQKLENAALTQHPSALRSTSDHIQNLDFSKTSKLPELRGISSKRQTNENPGQLANFNATIAGYTASPGEIQLTWKSWAVSYWIQGVKHNERHFDWEDCMEREAQANALDQSMWIGGAGRAGLIPLRAFYASPPPAVDSTLDFTLNLVFRVPGATGKHVPMKFGSGAPLDLTQVKPPTGTDPGYFFLSQLTGRGTPEFACKPRRTTILLYHAVLGQIETSAGSRAPELGYSVFHCGDGWLKVYRAVALEVIFSNADPEDMEVTWDAFRCAISPDLGQDGLRLLYSTDDMEAPSEVGIPAVIRRRYPRIKAAIPQFLGHRVFTNNKISKALLLFPNIDTAERVSRGLPIIAGTLGETVSPTGFAPADGQGVPGHPEFSLPQAQRYTGRNGIGARLSLLC